jgi:hypothetical protein
MTTSPVKLTPPDAATKIQAAFRGYLLRKQNFRLVFPHYTELQRVCNEIGITKFAEAPCGKTKVLLPQNPNNIVIKCTETKELEYRLEKAKEVHKVLQELNLKHIKIPKARSIVLPNGKTYLIEQRLPIRDKAIDCIALYSQYPEKFTDLVRESVQFFSKITIRDLSQKTDRNLIKNGLDELRHDNFPFFLNEKRQVSVGLVDVEHSGPFDGRLDSFTDLFKFFPFHCDIIIDEIKKQGLTLSPQSENNFREVASSWKDYYNYNFAHHLDWIQQVKPEASNLGPAWNGNLELQKRVIDRCTSRITRIAKNDPKNFIFKISVGEMEKEGKLDLSIARLEKDKLEELLRKIISKFLVEIDEKAPKKKISENSVVGKRTLHWYIEPTMYFTKKNFDSFFSGYIDKYFYENHLTSFDDDGIIGLREFRQLVLEELFEEFKSANVIFGYKLNVLSSIHKIEIKL